MVTKKKVGAQVAEGKTMISLRVDDDVLACLKEIADGERRTRAGVIAIALQDWVTMHRTGVLGEAYAALAALGEGEHYVNATLRSDVPVLAGTPVKRRGAKR